MTRFIDPAVQQLLNIWETSGRKPLELLPLEQARAESSAGAILMGATPPDVDAKDFDIDTPQGQLSVRVYRPRGHEQTAALPALLFLHGGGFVVGSIETHDGYCRHLTAALDACVLSLNYRLAPEHKFPAAAVDAKEAAKWMLREANALRVDPQRFAVGGDSAGGCLAAGLALQQGQDGIPNWQLQVLIYPLVDWSQQRDSHIRNGQGLLLTETAIQYFRDLYLRSSADEKDWLASPLLAPDHANAPPAFVLIAELDPLHDEGFAYSQCLRSAGVTVQLREVPGMVHGFITMTKLIPAALECTMEIAAALRKAWNSPLAS
ncbi:alpha/beta hydrolase [Pseudomonas sp. NFX98]|uniref:alpha/beta hydrolase n=1 Tax=Pseudomonas sp. NFX98 TaxID=3399122 RepID=UPI0039FD97F6